MGKTSKVMAGITSTAMLIGLSGCGSNAQDLPPVPEDSNCSDWEWDEDDGVWECDDRHSMYYGHFFYGGFFYRNKSSLYKAKDYISYKNSPAFKGKSSTSSGTGAKKSSGFGSGSKSFGG